MKPTRAKTKTYTYTVADPGADTPSVTESCGANATRTDTAAPDSFDCTFPDGPASSTVEVSADDGDDLGSDEIAVTIANLAPTVVLSGGNTYAFPESGTTQRSFAYSASDPAGVDDPLTITIDCGTNGSYVAASNTGSSFKCVFADGGNPSSSSTVSIEANDGDGGTASDSHSVTIENVAPTGNAHGPYSGKWGNSISFEGTATDPAGANDTLTYEWDFDYSGSFSADTNGANPTHSYAAPGEYTAALRVSDEDGGVDSIRTATVTVSTHPTSLTYSGETSKQYSDVAELNATLLDGSTGIAGKTITFKIGTQSTTATTNASGVATATLKITQADGSYTVSSSFAGDSFYDSSSDSDPFTVTKEDARAYYTGSLFSQTSSATSSTATVVLSATIKDITAVVGDSAYDADAGEIPYAKVTFVDGGGTPLSGCSNLPVGLVSLADTEVGTVTCNWGVNLGSSDSVQYTVGIKVEGRYTRYSSADNTVVTVSKPIGTNFITGGGYIVNQTSAGQKAGAAGAKTNFGFNVKYNKSGNSLQGNINVITRAGGRVYQIKGNAMSSLYVSNPGGTPSTTKPAKATFNGKANIQDITNPYAPEGIDGNGTLQVTMTDKGEPGRLRHDRDHSLEQVRRTLVREHVGRHQNTRAAARRRQPRCALSP